MDKDLSTGRRDLFKTKVEAMKNLILNNKSIPENWIFKRDYNEILEKAMTNPIVLQYAIINAEHHRNRAYPDYAMKKSQTLPRKSFTLSKPQLHNYNNYQHQQHGRNHKIRTNKSEYNYNYAHTTPSNDNDFLLTSIVERELELPPISI